MPNFLHVSSIGIFPSAGHRTQVIVWPLRPFRTSAGLSAYHLSYLFLLVLLSLQAVPIGLQPCRDDPVDIVVVHGDLCWCLVAFPGMAASHGKVGIPGPKTWAIQEVRAHQSLPDTCCFCETQWTLRGWSEQWELWPGHQNEAPAGCYGISSQLLVPIESQKLVGRCFSGHGFILLLPMYTVSYLGMIFSGNDLPAPSVWIH